MFHNLPSAVPPTRSPCGPSGENSAVPCLAASSSDGRGVRIPSNLPISGSEAMARTARLKAAAAARRADSYSSVSFVLHGQFMEFLVHTLNEAAVLRQWALAAGARAVVVSA